MKNRKSSPEVRSGCTDLKYTWCIHEMKEMDKSQRGYKYQDSISKVYKFSTLEEFASLWKHTKFSKLSMFFYNLQKHGKYKVLRKHESKLINCFYIFKRGIKPTWEDPSNKKGCSIIFELKIKNGQKMNDIWKFAVFSLVGNTVPFDEKVNGLRVSDRLKGQQLIKVEIWLLIAYVSRKRNKEGQIN